MLTPTGETGEKARGAPMWALLLLFSPADGPPPAARRRRPAAAPPAEAAPSAGAGGYPAARWPRRSPPSAAAARSTGRGVRPDSVRLHRGDRPQPTTCCARRGAAVFSWGSSTVRHSGARPNAASRAVPGRSSTNSSQHRRSSTASSTGGTDGGSQRPSPPRKNAISTMYVSPPA